MVSHAEQAGTERREAFVVAAKDTGKRLDKFLAERIPELGRRGVKRLLADRRVQVAGRFAEKSHRLTAGQEVRVVLLPAGVVAGPTLPLTVVMENSQFVVLNKPAGQPTVPLQPGEGATLANALMARYPECSGVGGLRDAGLVHRLDTHTSGLLIAARHPEAFAALREIISSGKLTKRYLAIVAGVVSEPGVIEHALLPSSRSKRRVLVAGDELGHPKRKTAYVVLEARQGYSLLEVEVSRAYRHQIRAHLADAGYPIVGDQIYGAGPHPALGSRHALHASYAAFAGDVRMGAFEASAPLPPDLTDFWASLGS